MKGKCDCNTGYKGKDCSIRFVENGKLTAGKVICDEGFTGIQCEIRTCTDDCNNNGKCVNGTCLC